MDKQEVSVTRQIAAGASEILMVMLSVAILGWLFGKASWSILFSLYFGGLVASLYLWRRLFTGEDALPIWVPVTWFVWVGTHLFGQIERMGDRIRQG